LSLQEKCRVCVFAHDFKAAGATTENPMATGPPTAKESTVLLGVLKGKKDWNEQDG